MTRGDGLAICANTMKTQHASVSAHAQKLYNSAIVVDNAIGIDPEIEVILLKRVPESRAKPTDLDISWTQQIAAPILDVR